MMAERESCEEEWGGGGIERKQKDRIGKILRESQRKVREKEKEQWEARSEAEDKDMGREEQESGEGKS